MGYLRCERERTMRRKGKKGERAYILKLRQDSSFIRMSFFFLPLVFDFFLSFFFFKLRYN